MNLRRAGLLSTSIVSILVTEALVWVVEAPADEFSWATNDRERMVDGSTNSEVRVPLAVVRTMISDLLHSRELQLRARRNTIDHLTARQTLGEALRDWIQSRVELSERDEQKTAVAELVEWLIERPELEELYLSDIQLYWMLRLRVWDVREELANYS